MSGRALIGLFALLVAVLVGLTLTQPAPLDTRIRLEREGEAPFDAEVFYAALGDWMGQPIETSSVPPYERLADTSLAGETYVFMAPTFEPESAEAERLLDYVARGNALFIATTVLGGPLAEGLGAAADSSYDGRRGLRTTWDELPPFLAQGDFDADTLRLVAPGVAGDYGFPISVRSTSLDGLDTARTEVLGTDEYGDPGLVRVRHGAGTVVVSSSPLAFTNAALTGEGDAEAYVGGVLAALPPQPLVWDDYAKPYKTNARTPLRYVLQTPALRWAYLLSLLFVALFVAFRGRRWQRPIPVVAPPPNAEREFARTVGRLHLVRGSPQRFAQRKARVVRDRLRTRLRLTDADFSDGTALRAARRVDADEETALRLFARLRHLEGGRPLGDDALVQLDRDLDAFFGETAPPPSSAP